jgi:hypothetical protein
MPNRSVLTAALSAVLPPWLLSGLDFVFHMFFLVKYCKSLEEGECEGGRRSLHCQGLVVAIACKRSMRRD